MLKGNCEALNQLLNSGFTHTMLAMALRCHRDTISKYVKNGVASERLKEKSGKVLQKITEKGIKCPQAVKVDYEQGLEPVFRSLLN